MNRRNFSKSLKVSLKENSSAYGYSISITGSYALLDSIKNKQTPGQIFAAAAGAAVAFLVIELATLAIFRNLDGGIAERTRILARLMNLVSVLTSIGAAGLCALYLPGIAAWFFGTFCSTCVFLLLDAVELSIVEDADKQG